MLTVGLGDHHICKNRGKRNCFTRANPITHHLMGIPARTGGGTCGIRKTKNCTSKCPPGSCCPLFLTVYFRAKQSIQIDQSAEPSPKGKRWILYLPHPITQVFQKQSVPADSKLCRYEQFRTTKQNTQEIWPPGAISNPYPQTLCRKDATEK